MQIQYKPHLFARRQTLELREDHLARLRDGKELERVMLADIRVVQLARPTQGKRATAAPYRCTLRHTSGKLVLQSELLPNLSQGGAYLDLVAELHRQLQPVGPRVRYRRSSIGDYAFLMFALVWLSLFAAFPIAWPAISTGQGRGAVALAIPAALAIAAGTFMGYFKRYGKFRYDPRCLPLELLPRY